ncbi:MAG: hypothetical protein Q8R28_21425, partial [Dehalococcoidia bacterium]|nr:hypothetical protein [Dehalococcoidia bacterium]
MPGIVFQAIIDIVASLGQVLFNVVKTVVRALALEESWYGIRDFVLQVWTDIVNGIKTRLNTTIGDINNFVSAVNSIASLLKLPTLGLKIKPFNIEQFIPPPRPGWFGDQANESLDLFNKNIEKAKTGSNGLSEFLDNLFKPGMTGGQIGPEQWAGFADSGAGAKNAVAALNTELAKTGDAAKSAGDKGQTAIHAMEREVDATQDAVKGLEANIRGLESALNAAQDAMMGFAEPLLVGMGAADDAIFAMEQALKQAQLAELEVGKAAKDAQEEVKDSFNQLAAEQAEISQGIPVALTKMKWEQEQARRAAEAAARKASEAPKQEGETPVEALQRALRIAQLQKELNFDPQMRALKKHFNDITGASKEITFAEAMAGMDATNATAAEITSQLGLAQGELDGQKAVLEVQQILLDGLKQAYQDQADAARGVTTATESTLGLDNLRTASLA